VPERGANDRENDEEHHDADDDPDPTGVSGPV